MFGLFILTAIGLYIVAWIVSGWVGEWWQKRNGNSHAGQ